MYLVEIQNIGDRLVCLTCPAKAPLMLIDAGPGHKPERVALTSEQFASMAYDLEGFSEGVHGVTKQLQIYVTNLDTGKCDAVSFSDAEALVSGKFAADEAARAAQAEQEARAEESRKAAQANLKADPNTLAGAVQTSVSKLA